jgi:opine dehydrogenase
VTPLAVLGAGAGGLATAVELAQAGHEVRLWSRNPATVAPYRRGAVTYRGLLGEGEAKVALVTTKLADALDGANAVVVSLPAFLHGALFADMAELRWARPVVLSPGHTGGALHFRHLFSTRGLPAPPVAELSTLPYVSRVAGDATVSVTGRAHRLRCGTLPGDEEAGSLAEALFACCLEPTDVLASSLSNVNLVLHPPGAVLAAAWVEATGGGFTFYIDAMTPGVARLVDALDRERLEVARLLGHELPVLVEEMARVGTVPGSGGAPWQGTAEAVRRGEANRSILAPSSLAHRYYKEDFAHGLAPFLALADAAGAEVPIARSLLTVGRALVGDEMPPDLDAARLGIDGLDARALMALARR